MLCTSWPLPLLGRGPAHQTLLNCSLTLLCPFSYQHKTSPHRSRSLACAPHLVSSPPPFFDLGEGHLYLVTISNSLTGITTLLCSLGQCSLVRCTLFYKDEKWRISARFVCCDLQPASCHYSVTHRRHEHPHLDSMLNLHDTC